MASDSGRFVAAHARSSCALRRITECWISKYSEWCFLSCRRDTTRWWVWNLARNSTQCTRQVDSCTLNHLTITERMSVRHTHKKTRILSILRFCRPAGMTWFADQCEISRGRASGDGAGLQDPWNSNFHQFCVYTHPLEAYPFRFMGGNICQFNLYNFV